MKLDKNTKLIALGIAALFLLKDKIFNTAGAAIPPPPSESNAGGGNIVLNSEAYKEQIRTLQRLIKADDDGKVGTETLGQLANYTPTIPSPENVAAIIFVVRAIKKAIDYILINKSDTKARAYMASQKLDFNKYVPGAFQNLQGVSLSYYLDAYKTGTAGSW